ncbi:MAG TPA: holo-ACP synthase [Firmicutes bacterium]|nr:holo-ACP synthase [Bacillota bacterium]
MRCGVDIIEIDRVARAFGRRPRQFLQRLFTAREQEQLAARDNAARHLAARFAAKEAVFKLLGLGIGSLNWTEVEILSLPGGEPVVHLSGKAAKRAEKLSLSPVALSLSHSREYAVASAAALVLQKH